MTTDNISVQSLHDALNDDGYICSPEFSAQLTTAIRTKPVGGAFLHGMAGTGKSYLPHVLSNVLSRPLYSYQCTNRTQPEDLLSKPMPDEVTKSGIKIMPGVLLEASKMSHEKQVILMLDEWDKTRPNADGFFLDFLQYGKLSIPGMSVEANLNNMLIFFTANDDRTFHEALLRRFPKMDIKPMKPKTVHEALSMTHEGHPYMSSMIDLYCRSINGRLPKPATIQELRQLMDAIDVLGDGADWNTLVYQYVTKTPENHEMLNNTKKVDTENYDKDSDEYAVLDANDFGIQITETNGKTTMSKMPSISFDMPVVGNDNKSDLKDEEIFGVFERNDRILSDVMHVDIHEDDPDDCVSTDWYTITKDIVYLKHPYSSTDVHYIQRFYRDYITDGEIKVYDTYVTRKEISRLLRGKGWYIHKRDKYEIIARKKYGDGTSIDLRYADGEGMEVIIPAKAKYKTDIFRFSESEHLSHCLPLFDKMSEKDLNALPNDIFRPSNILAGDLKEIIKHRNYVSYGSSLIKSLSEHNEYCNMTLLVSPVNSRNAPDADFSKNPLFKLLKPNINPYGDRSLHIEGRNIEIMLSDFFEHNGSVSVVIKGAVDGVVLKELYRWIHHIPIYTCFKFSGDLFNELLDMGWEVNPDNMQCLVQGDFYARFVYDYVVFATFVKYNKDEMTTEMLLQTQINRITHLEEEYNKAV
tara:strand:- start:3205 stop:5289 length:2085 start_codon:yes stop_codon:yes gene_type:complete